MIYAVIDTNVLVSALFTSNPTDADCSDSC